MCQLSSIIVYVCLITLYTLLLHLNGKRVTKVGRKKPDKLDENVERIFFTFLEAQEFLGVSHQTIYKLMKEGLPSHKIGKKRVFLKDDLIRWIREH
jgi:excisionase family DNA binding protein